MLPSSWSSWTGSCPEAWTGITTICEFRKIPAFANLPVILVSAYSCEPELKLIGEMESAGFLGKPVQPDDLAQIMGKVLGIKQEAESRVRDDGLITLTSARREHLLGAKILLAEDNLINQEVATEILSDVGIVVTVANNGQEAVEAIMRQPWDAVLMDMQMPVMDGYQAAREVRKDPRFLNLPIIAMTAHAMSGDAEKCFEAGMNDYVPKPFEPADLFAVLAKWVKPASQRIEEGSFEPEAAAGTDADKATATQASGGVGGGQATAPQAPSAGFAGVRESVSELPFDDLPGFDIPKGLAHCGGKTKLFLQLLKSFTDHYSDGVQQIRAALDSDDTELAARLAHSIKGVSGTIGAEGLYAAAGHLESSIRHGTDSVGEDLAAFGASLDAVLSALSVLDRDGAAPLPGGSAPIDRAAVVAILTELRGALEDDYGRSVECCAALKACLAGTALAPRVQELEQALDDIDTDSARAAFEAIAAQIETGS